MFKRKKFLDIPVSACTMSIVARKQNLYETMLAICQMNSKSKNEIYNHFKVLVH